MLTVDAKGVFPIAPTPFLADGSIDEASVDRMIDHYVAAGADGCTMMESDKPKAFGSKVTLKWSGPT